MPSEHLRRILDEIDFLIGASAPLCRESFLGDDSLRRAFVRSLDVIGEAAARLAAEAGGTEHGLRAVQALQHRVRRDFFEVDYDLVWDAVARVIPDLRPGIRALLAGDGTDQSGSNR